MVDLFDTYAKLLKRRFSEDFQEVKTSVSKARLVTYQNLNQIVSTDDYMPMAINSKEEYEKVINVSWFAQEKNLEDLPYASPLQQPANVSSANDYLPAYRVCCPSRRCIRSAA